MSRNIHPSISVIVPVYNVAPYIEKCARSLFEQTLQSLEILFIDDCSPDNSAAIIRNLLKLYPQRVSQTRIIRLDKNSGQAGARKVGILNATGEYIIHCDGDDWVDLNLYETLYRKAVETNADIVVCDEVMEFDGYTVPKNVVDLPSSGKDIMENWYQDAAGLFCHNKLVKRKLYTDNGILPWEGLNMWEDNGLFARLFYFADKVEQIHGGPLYHYNRSNVNAMTSGYGIRQVEQMIGIASNLADFFNSQKDAARFQKTVDAFKYLARINLITDSFANYALFRKTFTESKYIASELDRTAFSRKGRLRFYMVKSGFSWLFILLFKIKKAIS